MADVVLGIETSCDETSAAVLVGGRAGGRHGTPELASLVILSQDVQTRHVVKLLRDSPEGVGYLLKDRVAHLAEFAPMLRVLGSYPSFSGAPAAPDQAAAPSKGALA